MLVAAWPGSPVCIRHLDANKVEDICVCGAAIMLIAGTCAQRHAIKVMDYAMSTVQRGVLKRRVV